MADQRYQIVIGATTKGVRSSFDTVKRGAGQSLRKMKQFNSTLEQSRRLSAAFGKVVKGAFYSAAGATGIGYMVSQSLRRSKP